MIFEVASTEVISGGYAVFNTAVNAAFAAGKFPIGGVDVTGVGTYAAIFGTPRYPKQFPKYAGGGFLTTDAANVVSTLNGLAGKKPTIMWSGTGPDGTDDYRVLYALKTA